MQRQRYVVEQFPYDLSPVGAEMLRPHDQTMGTDRHGHTFHILGCDKIAPFQKRRSLAARARLMAARVERPV